MRKIFLITLLLFLFLVPISTQAAIICDVPPLVPCGRTGTTDCKFCHIFELLNNIIVYILTCLTPIIAALMMVIGGFYLLIAGASPELFSQAKSIITAAVIGLVIIFVSWVFLNTFLDMIGVAEWTGLGTWWKIKCP